MDKRKIYVIAIVSDDSIFPVLESFSSADDAKEAFNECIWNHLFHRYGSIENYFKEHSSQYRSLEEIYKLCVFFDDYCNVSLHCLETE